MNGLRESGDPWDIARAERLAARRRGCLVIPPLSLALWGVTGWLGWQAWRHL